MTNEMEFIERRVRYVRNELLHLVRQCDEILAKGGGIGVPSGMIKRLALIDAVEAKMSADPDRHWTVKSLKESLEGDGYEFNASTERIALQSISVALKRLTDRGQAAVVKVGRGPLPSEYVAK